MFKSEKDKITQTTEGMRIAEKFNHYAKTHDKTAIEGIPVKDIQMTLGQYERYRGTPHYKAMVNRIEELKEEARYKSKIEKQTNDKRQGFIQGFITGVIAGAAVTAIAGVLINLFK